MEETKYILATVKIPMLIKSDETIETLPDYMSILFENLKELPNKSETDYNNQYIKNMVKDLLLNDTNSDELSELESEHNEAKYEEIEDNSENGKSDEKLQMDTDEQIPMITIDELTVRKQSGHKKNLSFKNKLHSVTRFTAKNYGNG